MTGRREVHVVYDDRGTIVALVEAGESEGPGGVRLSSTPLAGPGQHTVLAAVADEHAGLSLAALLERGELDHDPSPPVLRVRAL